MVSTRSSTVTPTASSSTSIPNPPQQNAQSDTNLTALLVQQSQLLLKMEQRLANLEARDQLLASSAATPTPPMQAPVAPAATSAVILPMQAPATLANNPAPYTHPAKDPSERIKTSEVPSLVANPDPQGGSGPKLLFFWCALVQADEAWLLVRIS